MAAPAVVSTYPTSGDVGIPVGVELLVYFDRGVDQKTAMDSIVLFAAESDFTSGPDSAAWIDDDTGDNPYFLSSPGFKGFVPLNYEFVYWNTNDQSSFSEIDPGVLTSEADEIAAAAGHLVKLTVNQDFASTLAPDTQYTLTINGNPNDTDTGVGSRTVFDVVADSGNAGSGELASVYGTWEGLVADTLHLEITAAGNIGTAEYRWWYESAGESEAVTGRVTHRRYRRLDDGLQVQFTGSAFEVGDKWTVNLEPLERMSTSYSFSFTTNDGSYELPPDSPSTPASSSPPASVLPTNVDGNLEVLEMDPPHTSYQNNKHNRIITIVFSEDVDADTITDDAVTLWKYPVEGHYDGTFAPDELEKTLSVSGSILTITF